MTYTDLSARLTPLYGAGEARAIVRMVLEEAFQLSATDIYMGKVSQLSADERAKLEKMMLRLEKWEPVQYVLGYAYFGGRRVGVAPGVLIPRPETQGLIPMLADDCQAEIEVLDIGTGSGCIAISAALDYPQAKVTAWDISAEALAIARANGDRLGAQVAWRQQDALHAPDDRALWDVIVSNPPYICEQERADMADNVLRYEPATALFVPDDDPLRFYHAIALYALHALRPGGRLCLEINPLYAEPLTAMLTHMEYSAEIINDQYGRQRFIKAHL